MAWSFDKILERTQRTVSPDDQAIIFGDSIVTWGALARRTDGLAAGLLAHGAAPGDKLAHYLRNGPEYIETSVAGFKAGLVHVNVNYRYTADELFYLFDNSDAAVIVYNPEFAPQIAQLRERLTKVKLFVETGAGAPVNPFALRYEELAAAELCFEPPRFAEDPLLFIYTGGTTGMPKGVMWRHEDLWVALGGPRETGGYDEFEADLRAGNRGARVLICPPLMHGAGYMFALLQLLRGGTVLMAPGASFDPDAVLAMIGTHKPAILLIVGDAFGRPLARALGQTKADCASLGVIISSGAMWSSDVKDEITAAIPHVRCLDALGSSEVIGLGVSVRGGGRGPAATRFKSDPMTRIIDDEGMPVAPGIAGRIARAGPVPLGYYKDPEKTARTFITIDGVRHVLPGDYGCIEADGSIKLLGRGNMVINSGGEKIFVEEIEEALKKHPAIDDALVFGMPDPVWGQAVTAVVEAQTPVSAEVLRGFLAEGLARYKLPKMFCFVDKVPRGPNGKANYEAARTIAAATHGATT